MADHARMALARETLDGLVSRGRTPGLQYVVVTPDGTRFEQVAGLADVAGRRAMTADTTLMAYSMSKTITAVAAVQLAEAGRLQVDDPVARYAETPYGGAITIRQLIAHTSGLANPLPLRWVHPLAQHDAFDDDAALDAVMRSHPRLTARPGTRYRYSNIGYWLLGRVIARASGTRFVDYVRTHVLDPLGVASPALGYRASADTPHACGYLERYSLLNLIKGFVIDRDLIGAAEGHWVHVRDHCPNGAAFGGLLGCASGFAAFLQDQLRPASRILGERGRQLFFERQSSARGPIAMTMGWHIGSRDGTPFFYKEGGGGGFHCLMRLYPSRAAASVVMMNATTIDVAGVMDRIDAMVID